MAAIPEGPCIRRAEITDLYFTDTRMRLRRTVEVMRAGTSSYYKLTQKIPHPSAGPGLITTFYLEDAEYQVLRSLPSAGITKTRYSIPPLGIDVFSGSLTGLVLGEAEFESAEQEAHFQIPVDSAAEVTTDIRFTGGRLAHMVRSDLFALLTDFGLEPLDSSELESRSLSATTG
jgi:CYTH domain-containing protein